MLLSEAIEALAIATRADGRSSRTVEAYREKLGHLLRFLGDVPVESVTVHDLRRYVAGLYGQSTRYEDHPRHQVQEGGLSPFTIAGRVRTMKRLFRWLCEEGQLESNPAARIKTPRPKREKPKGITLEDFQAMLATAQGDGALDVRDRALLMFLFDTGCRVGGLCSLSVDALDFERQRATVREKGGKTRIVFYRQSTARALAKWLEVRPVDRGPNVFVTLGTGGKAHGGLAPRGVAEVLRQRSKAGGATGHTNPHAFRHGFARYFLLSGGDLGTLSDILGHSDVGVTKAYYGIFTADELAAKHARHSPLALLEVDGDDS